MGIKNVSFRAVIIVIACAIFVSCMRGEDYRKIIEKKGIPFTQESFLKEVRAGNREHAELFIKAGMDINTRDKDGWTALRYASIQGRNDIIKLLTKAKDQK